MTSAPQDKVIHSPAGGDSHRYSFVWGWLRLASGVRSGVNNQPQNEQEVYDNKDVDQGKRSDRPVGCLAGGGLVAGVAMGAQFH